MSALDRNTLDDKPRSQAALGQILRTALWPAVIVATTTGFVLSFASGYFEAALLGVPAAILVILLGAELALPDRRGGDSVHDPQLLNDAVHSVVGQGLGNALGQAAFVVTAAVWAGEISERWGANLWPSGGSLFLQVPLLIILADGLDYWRHRFMHTTPWAWPIHALHHDADRLNVMKSGRGHFLDMFLRNLLCYAPLALIGVPREVMLAYAAAVTVLGPVAHANVSLMVPAFLHRWVMTPQVHHLHHARPQDLSCSNYANVFPIWDILFGTFTHPDEAPDFEYGIDGEALPSDILGQTLAPFASFARWRKALAAENPLPRGAKGGGAQ